jgi:predicted O-methyltransferase YrrM
VTPPTLTSRLATSLWNRRNPQWAAGRPGHLPPHLDVGARDVPRYLRDSLAVRAAALRPPRRPWITRDALTILDQLLRPTDRGIEWGSGGTTAWFAERIEHLTSIEGSPQWHASLRAELDAGRVGDVDLRLVSSDDLGYETPEHRSAYVGAVPEIAPASLDLAFVDGEYRDGCALRALDLLRPGGLLVVDNAETYLPSTTRSPWRVDAPATPRWQEFAERTDREGWRHVWTTNGVWDTAIWWAPSA